MITLCQYASINESLIACQVLCDVPRLREEYKYANKINWTNSLAIFRL